jgi:3-oxoacyl-[acyl-carrier-protein] synthase II
VSAPTDTRPLGPGSSALHEPRAGTAPRLAPAAVVGAGAVTGYGWGFDALVAGLRSGASAARAQVVDGIETVAAVIPPAADDAGTPRFEQIAVAAVDDALRDARDRGWEPGPLVGVVFCTGIGDIESIRDNYFGDAQPRPSLFPRLMHTSVGSLLAQANGWTGPNVVVNAACSSGNAALQTAQLWLDAGLATDVVVAGAELCIIAEVVSGFRRMRVLLADGSPATECRPFQEGSRRFFLGEAAAALVLTRDDRPAGAGTDTGVGADGAACQRRRATYLGGATTHDAFHLVAPDADGVELERCYRDALAAAGVAPDDVAVIKAHGSGTPLNDTVELDVLDRVFGPATQVCSYKPLVGHAMAMASLLELTALLAGYELGALPGPVTDDPAHPRLATGGPPRPGLALCGSVGLGGANTVAVLDIAPPSTTASEGTPP